MPKYINFTSIKVGEKTIYMTRGEPKENMPKNNKNVDMGRFRPIPRPIPRAAETIKFIIGVSDYTSVPKNNKSFDWGRFRPIPRSIPRAAETIKFIIGVSDYTSAPNSTNRNRMRTISISVITPSFIYWIEKNDRNVSKKKKFFCQYRNCEYFYDNKFGIIYANKTFIQQYK